MTKTGIGLIAALILAPGIALAEGPPKSREVILKIPALSDVEKTCVEQLRREWSQPDNYDDTFRSMVLDAVYNRKEGQGSIVTFNGHAHNEFLQTDRVATVTCRITEKPPYNVSFSIDR